MSSARSTISIARTTPAQNPRGWARITCIDSPGLWYDTLHIPYLSGKITNAQSANRDEGHQLAGFEYQDLSKAEILKAVEDLYGRYYFRPRNLRRCGIYL